MRRISSIPGFILICTSLAICPLAGCVSKGKYDALLEERDELSRESGALARVATELSEEVLIRDREMQQLKREQQELAEELEVWIVAGMIKMELLKDGLHLILSHEILFPTASAELSETGREVLTKLVAELEQLPYQIGVLGYTDNVSVGGRLAERYPSNWELAGARAASVVRLMQGAGIPSERLVAVSFGQTRSIASNDTSEGRALNRRIEVRLRPVVP